jgi:hypothetical protein
VALNIKNTASPAAEDNHQKINFFFVIFFGFIIVLCSIAAYFLILKEAFGSFTSEDLFPSGKTYENLFSRDKAKIAVLYSDYTVEKLDSGIELLNDEVWEWEKFLQEIENEYEIIDDQVIENGDHFKYSLIVLPQVSYLSKLEAAQLKKYIKEGGSLFASGGKEIYLHDDSLKDVNLISEIFYLKFTAHTIESDSFYFMPHQISVFRGGTALTSGIPAGYKMNLSPIFSAKEIEIINNNVTQISFNQNYNGNLAQNLSSTYGFNEKGRFVWLGFNFNSVKEQNDRLVFERLITNSINWLLQKPVVYVKDFPGAYNAAAIIVPVLSDSIRNVYNILKILTDENIRVSFFINSEKSLENFPVIANLEKFGEIDVFYYSKPENINENFSFYNILRNESTSEAVNDIKKAKRILEQITENKCNGCIFYPEFPIQKASEIAQKAGFEYFLTDSIITYSPKINFLSNESSFIIFEVSSNDFVISESESYTDELGSYKNKIDSILDLQSLYVLKFRVENLSGIKQIIKLQEIIRYLKSKNFYITTASEFHEWLNKRMNLEVKAEKRGETRVYFQISNTGKSMVRQVAVDVDLNEISGITNLYLNPEFVTQKKATVLNINSKGLVSLLLEDINPGETRSYYIDYSKLNI